MVSPMKIFLSFLITDAHDFLQVSADELERRRIRRERNKVAASKCRKKRKEHVKTLVEVKSEFKRCNNAIV